MAVLAEEQWGNASISSPFEVHHHPPPGPIWFLATFTFKGRWSFQKGKNKRHRAQIRLFSFFAGCDSQSERLMLWMVMWWGCWCWCCSPLIHPRNGRSAVRIDTRPLFPRRALAQSKWFIYKRLAAVRAPARVSRGRIQVCWFLTGAAVQGADL